MKIRNLCALLLALMLLALAGCGQKEQPTQPENPDVPQEEETVPVRLVCSNGSTTLRFSREEDGHWLWADDKTFPLDESYALTLLETVQGIEHLPPVTNSAQLADYGLESPTKYRTKAINWTPSPSPTARASPSPIAWAASPTAACMYTGRGPRPRCMPCRTCWARSAAASMT